MLLPHAPAWPALVAWGRARRVTLALSGLVLALNVPALLARGTGSVVGALELRPGAIARGEAWRLLTGHLVHANTEQLLLGVVAFALLGSACEPALRGRYPTVLVLAALAVSAVVLASGNAHRMHHGLTGIDGALLLSVMARMLRDAWRSVDSR